ncbi:hypothetical protein QBZ16_002854 [Prototheca wickerhamii]|uniref:CCHC-type domain-containing protein n=1 Tax=Prototheca wickerhamii TaxID=3111 RepID=A0AAD9IIY3_PROWI|nr:hypothetical protein QBZ16_002854 [Prototheca wickerhamii]
MSLLIKERDYLRTRLDLLEHNALLDELAAHPSWPLAQDHLRPFDGENWGYARDWLSELETFFKLAELAEDSPQRVKVAKMNLHEEARDWYYAEAESGVCVRHITDWTQFRAVFLRHAGLQQPSDLELEVRESRTWVEAMQAAERHECKRKERVAEPGLASPGDAADGGSPRCFGCHAPDHEVRDCPERKAKKPQKKPVSKGKKQASREILLGLPYVNVAHPVIDYKELTWTETANL